MKEKMKTKIGFPVWQLIIFGIVVICCFITAIFGMTKASEYKANYLAADEAYKSVYQSALDFRKSAADWQGKAELNAVRIEIANTNSDKVAAREDAYKDEIQKLKVQLALRGIEIGDWTALETIDKDFAKQMEDLYAKEAEAELNAESYINNLDAVPTETQDAGDALDAYLENLPD